MASIVLAKPDTIVPDCQGKGKFEKREREGRQYLKTRNARSATVNQAHRTEAAQASESPPSITRAMHAKGICQKLRSSIRFSSQWEGWWPGAVLDRRRVHAR
jgi:hypothetical protein